MTRYEEQFYNEFSQLVKTMKEIASDIKEIKDYYVPKIRREEVITSENLNSPCYTYGEICKMKEEYEKARDTFNTQRTGEERNDK